MASPNHGNAPNGDPKAHKAGPSPYEIGEHARSNAAPDVAEFYEGLFANEEHARPCYLPDSGQDDDDDEGEGDRIPGADERDSVSSGEASGKSSVADNVSKEGKDKLPRSQDEGDEFEDSRTAEGGERDSVSSEEATRESSYIVDIVSKEGKEKSRGTRDSAASGPLFGRKRGSGMSTEKDAVPRSASGSSVSADDLPEKEEEDGEMDGADSSYSLEGRKVNSDRELSSDRALDESPSPSGSSQGGSTSGYVAGSGSSLENSAIDVEGATSQEGEGNGSSEPQGAWEPGKRHPNEDDTNISWRQHKKHFFILSNAGKPIYSRYGDENKLAGFSATLQAIMSFVEASGDTIHLVRAGDHQILFLVRGPLYLACISSTDEPYVILKGQLELLHGQLLLILTKAVEKCFTKNSKFDMRPLLGGTEVVFSSLIHTFNWDPASFIHAYTCLPLPYAARQAAVAALQEMTETGALFALLMCGTKVIGLVGPPKASLHPDDILLLSNFISSSDSFRTSESFSPVCLPRYNTSAFLYAYVQYLDNDTCLILLSGDSGNFFHLKECRARIEIVLKESEVLRAVNLSLLRGGLRVENLPEAGLASAEGAQTGDRPVSNAGGEPVSGIGGAAGLWHFIYLSTYLDQYVASEFSPPLHTRVAQKRLYRAYKRLHASMHENGAAGPHKMQFRKDENHVLLSWRTSDFELYAAFDPLAEKSDAISVCNRICQWLRDMESEIFLLGAAPFSWMNCILSLCKIQESTSFPIPAAVLNTPEGIEALPAWDRCPDELKNSSYGVSYLITIVLVLW